MVSTNKKTQRKLGNKKANKKVPPVPRSVRTALDRQAMEYAALLANPCSGPLVHSTFAGSGGSLITRFEYDTIVNTGANETASFGYFCPGFTVNSSSFNSFGFSNPAAPLLTDTTAATTINNLATQQPAFSFLNANAAAYRSVAACIQVSWPGTELARGGIIGVGQSTLTQFAGVALTAAQLRTMASHVERTPDGVIELKMVPNAESENWMNPTWALAPEGSMQDLPALFWSASGLSPGVGLRVRLVTVVEWKPKVNTGMMINSAATVANVSSHTTQNVLKYMHQLGEWAVNSPTIRRAADYGFRKLVSGISVGARSSLLLGV